MASRAHERERQVEQVIKKHSEALDSYKALLIWYWVEVDKAMSYDSMTATFRIQAWNLYRLTSPEAVSRALRRVIERKEKEIGISKDKWRVREEEKYRAAYSRT